jgi:4-hydroxy-4-methyl-2-oxoglutarate aldolase
MADSSDILLKELRNLDTACLCDADKSFLNAPKPGSEYVRLKLLNNNVRPVNSCNSRVMAGVARTVKCTDPDDMLALLRGLDEAKANEVLFVNTLFSSRAVAGDLFFREAGRKGLSGIVVDGPVRDTACLPKDSSVWFYATSISPYSGILQSVGKMQEVMMCGGIEVCPGEIVVGDKDGILVGSYDSFQTLLPAAKALQEAYENVRNGISEGSSFTSMTTGFEEHIQLRLAGKASKGLARNYDLDSVVLSNNQLNQL